MKELRLWSFFNCSYEDFPSLYNLQLQGLIYGDPRFDDGTLIITSRIISAQARSVITENGSHYLLDGNPNNDWNKIIQLKFGFEFNSDFPFEKILIGLRD